jgi:parallel beta-helix repeat protein
MRCEAKVIVKPCRGDIGRIRPRAWLLSSALLAAGFSHAPAAGIQVYVVDNQHPAASPAGPGTAAQPYSTIMSALLAHPDSGTQVVVRPGVYRERVTFPASGSGAMPIVVRAEGEVTLDGADDLTSAGTWGPYAGDVWYAPGVDWDPLQVFADGVRLQRSSAAPPDVPPGCYRWVAGIGLLVNLGGDNPRDHGAAAGRRAQGFYVQGREHILIDGFRVIRNSQKGIEILNSAHVSVRRSVVTLSASGGIAVENSSRIQVHGNRVSDNDHHGIEFRGGVTGSRIDGNESFANVDYDGAGATGIYLAGSPGNVIENNRTYGNQDTGIEVQSGSDDCVIRQNVSWSNGDHGFMQLFATGGLLLNNVAWGNHTEGFSVEGRSTGTRIYNSISLNRALAPESYCVFVDTSSTAGFDADYNIYWNVADQPPIKFGGAAYPNVMAFQVATGIGPNSYGAEPRFVNPFQGDFHLRPDSPAIDAATTVVLGWVESDAEGRMRMDAPATPNTGTGLLPFADRGAHEFTDGTLDVGPGTPGGRFLAAAYPNPVRRTVTFAIELAAPGRIGLRIFDVLGREVWSEEGARPAGRTELRWGLTDRSGARVPNGVYLARASRGGEERAARFVVID